MPTPNYDLVAGTYQLSSHLYSTGQIAAAKLSQIKFLTSGDSILYLGVGPGEEAVEAAEAGMRVTCLDSSQGMLNRVQKKLQKRNLQAELLCQDAFEHSPDKPYDAVAANFFLNCFKKPDMLRMMEHAVSLVKTGGLLMVADVSLAEGNLFARGLNLVYLKSAMAIYWAMGLVPWHENYDYPALLEERGLVVQTIEKFRFAKIGPVVFQNTVAKRIDPRQD